MVEYPGVTDQFGINTRGVTQCSAEKRYIIQTNSMKTVLLQDVLVDLHTICINIVKMHHMFTYKIRLCPQYTYCLEPTSLHLPAGDHQTP